MESVTTGKHLTIAEKMARYAEDENGCWLWTGPVDGKGYGLVYDGERVTRAHRLSYVFHVDDLPRGVQVHHLCGMKRCINPDHLRAVTDAEHRELHPRFRPTCPKGHRRVVVNGRGRCRECDRIAFHARKASRLLG